MRQSILAIDDEKDVLEGIYEAFKKDFTIYKAENGRAGLEIIKKQDVSVVLLDYMMPGENGLSVLQKIKELDPTIEIIMVTAVTDKPMLAFELAKSGAFSYMIKPFDVADLILNVKQAAEKRSLIRTTRGLSAQVEHEVFIGECEQVRKIKETVKVIADHDTNIFIEGETGTGKEVLAKVIHDTGLRANKPFIIVNCGGLTPQFLESELFGHEKGAFTNAFESRIGKLELAEGGTIFLDELGNMPLEIQAKLLRVLEDKKIERLGGSRSIPVDVRLVSATNTDLKKAVNTKIFRKDLYYRLNTIPITLNPLRERGKDILTLFKHFLAYYNHKYNRHFKEPAEEVKQVLLNYPWPGNVRELKHLVERIVSINNAEILGVEHLPLEMLMKTKREQTTGDESLKEILKNTEQQIIRVTLKECGGNQNEAAKKLGVAPSTLSEKLKSYVL
ncbi:sigma-54-dependent transcriptional regulator [Candidatus Margulisiibacteriota bacterium]